MNWSKLEREDQLEEIDKESASVPVLIYKHSIRCHISAEVRREIESSWMESYARSVKPWMLEVITHGDLARAVEQRYGVRHESPQALLIVNGKCVMHDSHSSIDLDRFIAKAAA